MSDAGPDTAQRGGPGSRLRRAREARGLTEQQAAEQLNLDATAVVAMENDDLAALGAPVFARGHLRRYGALLGVPDEELLTSYGQARTQPEQPSLVPHSRLEMAPVRSRPVWAWAIGGALLFLVAAALVAYVSEYGLTLPASSLLPGADRSVPAESVPVVAAGSPVPAGAATGEPAARTAPSGVTVPGPAADAAVMAPAASDVAAAPAEATIAAAGAAATAAAPDASAAPPVPPGHVSVTVSFATDSWAEIYDGAGKAVLYDLGRAGTQRTISAAAPLSVTFGNAPGVTLAVNGRSAALPPRPVGQSVARFQIAADGTLR